MRQTWLAVFAACHPAPDPSPLALSLSVPRCLVLAAEERVSIGYRNAREAELVVETHAPSGRIDVLMRRQLRARGEGEIVLEAAALELGVSDVLVSVHAFGHVSENLSLALERREALAASGEDGDGDCYSPRLGDCNDASASIHPRALEVCGDRVDNDCNAATDEPGCTP